MALTSFISENFFDSSTNTLKDAAPQTVYKKHNAMTNPTGDCKVTAIKQVYNAKYVSRNMVKESLGLTSKNDITNFCKSMSDLRLSDKTYRQSHGNHCEQNGALDTKHLGIVREFIIKYPCDYERQTTPFRCTLFDYYSVLLGYECCKCQRAVMHLDGTGSSINWGVVIGSGD